jgi:hypothetical protein
MYLFLYLELAVFVPTGLSAGSTRVTIPLVCSFEYARGKLHDAIGCQNIPKKPVLQYKMEKTGRVPISLENENDWQGLRDHVKTLGKKDKIIQGEIVVDPKEVIPSILRHNCQFSQ